MTSTGSDMKALAQTVDDRQQHGGIGGVARQHLGANRPALAIDDHGQDHLLQVRPMILRMAMSPQAFTPRATEGQAGRIHKDQREVAEQIATPLEQALLDQVLDAARRQGAGRGDLFAEPRHCPGVPLPCRAVSVDNRKIKSAGINFPGLSSF